MSRAYSHACARLHTGSTIGPPSRSLHTQCGYAQQHGYPLSHMHACSAPLHVVVEIVYHQEQLHDLREEYQVADSCGPARTRSRAPAQQSTSGGPVPRVAELAIGERPEELHVGGVILGQAHITHARTNCRSREKPTQNTKCDVNASISAACEKRRCITSAPSCAGTRACAPSSGTAAAAGGSRQPAPVNTPVRARRRRARGSRPRHTPHTPPGTIQTSTQHP